MEFTETLWENDMRRIGLIAAALFATMVQADEPKQVFPLGVSFRAISLDGVAFAEKAAPTLTVQADGRLAGSAGCNRYFGRAEIRGAVLTLSGIGMTRMMCPEPAIGNENRFAPAISAATGWRIEGSDLIIETGRGALRFTRP